MEIWPVDTFRIVYSQMPLPSFSNQQICGSFQIAPGVYAQAYVPTAAERYGDFSDFRVFCLTHELTTPLQAGLFQRVYWAILWAGEFGVFSQNLQ